VAWIDVDIPNLATTKKRDRSLIFIVSGPRVARTHMKSDLIEILPFISLAIPLPLPLELKSLSLAAGRWRYKVTKMKIAREKASFIS
jgi:hypothetical protein